MFDNVIYESNPQNVDFDDLPFNDDESWITRRNIFCINDDSIFKLNNGWSDDI